MTIEFSRHSLLQMSARGISEEVVLTVIQFPNHIVQQDQSIMVYTKLIEEDEKRYIYRVFVNITKKPQLVITVYKTSKINKYGDSIR
jgi:hypothetical protein